MNIERSGEIYQLRLDFNLGFSYVQLLDFSDVNNFSGWLIYVYNWFETDKNANPTINQIECKSIALGPISMPGYPAKRGKYAWKYIGKTENLIATKLPLFKHLRGHIIKDNNWANLKPWFIQNEAEIDTQDEEVDYSKIRHLETEILNSQPGIATKATMYKIITEGDNVWDYYNLDIIENKILFIQLVNTYFSIDKSLELLGYLQN